MMSKTTTGKEVPMMSQVNEGSASPFDGPLVTFPVDRPWCEFQRMMPARMARKPRRKRHPCIWDDPIYMNIWSDRTDMDDAVAWVRRMRGKASVDPRR